MPTEAEMMADLAAADAAGDVQLAQHIAGRIKAARGASPSVMSSHAGGEPYEPPRTGRLESGVRGALQGLSMGWADEGAAAVDAALPSFLRNETSARAVAPSLSDVVAGNTEDTFNARRLRARDYYRSRNARAEASNPGTYLAGQIGGAAAPTLIGGAPAAGIKGALRAAGIAAGQGAAQGAGYSENEGLGLASDTALGAGLGLAGYGTGALLGKGASAAVRKGRELVRTGTARAGAQATKEASEQVASAIGKLGNETAQANRHIEWIIRLLDEEASGVISPANRTALEAFRQTPAYTDLVNAAASATLKKAAGSTSQLAAREAEVAALSGGLPQAIAARTAQLTSPAEAKTQVLNRLVRYGLPGLGSAVGATIGGPAGAAVGALAGAGTRPMMHSIIRGARNPAVQTQLGQLLERVGQYGQTPMSEALRRALAAGLPASAIAAAVDEEN